MVRSFLVSLNCRGAQGVAEPGTRRIEIRGSSLACSSAFYEPYRKRAITTTDSQRDELRFPGIGCRPTALLPSDAAPPYSRGPLGSKSGPRFARHSERDGLRPRLVSSSPLRLPVTHDRESPVEMGARPTYACSPSSRSTSAHASRIGSSSAFSHAWVSGERASSGSSRIRLARGSSLHQAPLACR
jgi:hypothetical protein